MAVGMLPLVVWLGFSLVLLRFSVSEHGLRQAQQRDRGGALATQGCYYLWNSLKCDPFTLTAIVFALGVACW